MAVQSGTTNASSVPAAGLSEISHVYVEGIIAGVIGAVTLATWFFILDIFSGQPFYTPNILGTALFGHGIGIEQAGSLPFSWEMVLIYTWVHGLVFCTIGGVAAKLLALAEQNANYGFGILIAFVIFEFGFVIAALVFAEPILQALTWPAILVGNLLAALAMGLYFWRHHPNLAIRP